MCFGNVSVSYSKTCSFSRDDELDVSRNGILTDARLHPYLSQLITCLWERNKHVSNCQTAVTMCENLKNKWLKIYASQKLTVLMAIRASKLSTQLRTKSTGFPSSSPPWLKTQNQVYYSQSENEMVSLWAYCGSKSPNAVHEMCEVVHCGDVVIVGLKSNIWINVPM